MQDASAATEATVGRLSKLDPNPEARSANLTREEPPQLLKPEQKQRKRAQKKEVGTAGIEKTHLELGAGYKIAHKPGSGWSTFFRVLAKESKFIEVCELLEAGQINPTDKNQADELLSKMFVRKDVIEKMVRADSEWKQHAEKKMDTYSDRAKGGDDAAKDVLSKGIRVRDGEWKGNIREIISTANGYYNAIRKGIDIDSAPKKYKNVKKFKDAGVIFRQYPLKPKKEEHVCIMLFPSKFLKIVKQAISTSRGTTEE
jgi:hypothetical protein